MLRKTSRFLTAILLVIAGAIIVAKIVFTLTPPHLDKVDIRDGDLVFQTLLGTQGYAVMMASNSPYSHMGFVHVKDGKPLVVEAIGPVKETPLSEWVERGAGHRVAVMRIKDLPKGAAQKAYARAKKDYGRPYDFYFFKGEDALYCSELARLSFSAAGITLGSLQKVADLKSSPAMEEVIKERWQNYPLCRGVTGMTFEKCRALVMEQELVTPDSIAHDPQVTLVYSNYPLD